jgi:lipoprotein signal peptidase
MLKKRFDLFLNKYYLQIILIFLTLLVVDKIIKIRLLECTHCDIIIKNSGFAFGILSGWNFNTTVAFSSWLVICIYSMFYWSQFTKKWKIVFSGLIFGGLGNIIDRIRFGHVIDYLPFFGVFTANIGDIIITISVLIGILYSQEFIHHINRHRLHI